MSETLVRELRFNTNFLSSVAVAGIVGRQLWQQTFVVVVNVREDVWVEISQRSWQ